MIAPQIHIDTQSLERQIQHLGLEFSKRAYLRMIGQRVRDWLKQNAPRRPGRERRPRWKKLATSFRYRVQGDTVWVGTTNPKGRWYESGTSPHRITVSNAKALRIRTGGRVIYRRSIAHPGQPKRRLLPPDELAGRMAEEVMQDYIVRVIKASER